MFGGSCEAWRACKSSVCESCFYADRGYLKVCGMRDVTIPCCFSWYSSFTLSTGVLLLSPVPLEKYLRSDRLIYAIYSVLSESWVAISRTSLLPWNSSLSYPFLVTERRNEEKCISPLTWTKYLSAFVKNLSKSVWCKDMFCDPA